jgi:hypothetical protein
MRQIREELRNLPAERRKDVGAAVREGRAVADPRDAALAIRWAEHLETANWPRWVLPRTRPLGSKAWAWILYAAALVALLVWALWVLIWPDLPQGWRWVMLALLVPAVATTPITLLHMLRSFWNAPETVATNRELLRAGECDS